MPWGNFGTTSGGGGGNNPYDPAKKQGAYDASTNTPTLTNGVGTDGFWYLTSVAGNNTPGGISLVVNQVIIYNATAGLWEAGIVLENNSDYIIVGAGYAPNGDIVADGQTLSYSLGALQGQASQAASDIATNSSDIATLTSDISDINTELGTIQTDIQLLDDNKQNLITGPTNNHIVTTDALGQTKDSGISISGVQLLISAPTNNNVATMDGTGQTKNSGTALSSLVSNPMTTLGDLIFGAASGAPARLAGNTTTTPRFLKSLGDGTNATAETWAQIQYSDISGTPTIPTSISLYDNSKLYAADDFCYYANYIYIALSSTTGNIPSSSSTVWRQVSNVNYSKTAMVSLTQGNDTAGNGSYPFATVQAALNYVGINGIVNINDAQQVYPENLAQTANYQLLLAQQIPSYSGAFPYTLTLGSGFRYMTVGNISFTNPANTNPALSVVNGNQGNNLFYNCDFANTGGGTVAVQYSGTWIGNQYYTECDFFNDFVIDGTPSGTYTIQIVGTRSTLNLRLRSNCQVKIYNCTNVNVLEHTAGRLFINDVEYISGLAVTANVSGTANQLFISNSSFYNKSTGTYTVPTGTGTIPTQLLNVDLPPSLYTFAGLTKNITSGPVTKFVAGNTYSLNDIVDYNSTIWASQANLNTQTPSVASTNWLQISNFTSSKVANVSSVAGNDSKINTDIFATGQPALNKVGMNGIVRVINFLGTYAETITQTASNQLLTGAVSLVATQNATFQKLVLPTGLNNFQVSNISFFNTGSNLALDIQAGNVGSNTIIGASFGNATASSIAVQLSTGWSGLNSFHTCSFNENNIVKILNSATNSDQVVFINPVGTLNLELDTTAVVRVIGSGGGSQFTSSGNYILTGTNGLIKTSPDLGSWINRSLGTADDVREVVFNKNGVAIAVGGSGLIIKSTDKGATWTPKTSGTAQTLNGIAVNSLGDFFACGNNGVALLSTDDGETWTSLTTGTAVNLNDIQIDTDGFIGIVGQSGIIITSSNNGASFTTRSSGTVSQGLTGIAFYNGNAVVVGINWICVSSNRTTYTSVTSSRNLTSVAVNRNGLAIASGQTGTAYSASVSDLWNTWTDVSPGGTTQNFNDIKCNQNNIFVMGGVQGAMRSTATGASWSTINPSTTNTINAITYDNVVNFKASVNFTHTRGRIFLENLYIESWANNATSDPDNFVSISNCTMQDPFTGEYGIINGTGNVGYLFEDFNWDRTGYTFTGIGTDTVAGYPVPLLSPASDAVAQTGSSTTVGITPANATYMSYASGQKSRGSMQGAVQVGVTTGAMTIGNGTNVGSGFAFTSTSFSPTAAKPKTYSIQAVFTLGMAAGAILIVTPTATGAGTYTLSMDPKIMSAIPADNKDFTMIGQLIVTDTSTPVITFVASSVTGAIDATNITITIAEL